MRYLIFLILSLSSLSVEVQSLTYESLTNEMDEQEIIETGLYKLSEDEQKNLDAWIRYQCGSHFLTLPKVTNGTDQTSYLTTTKQLPNGLPSNDKWTLALVAVFQNEAPYLREFIEFHKRVGVEHFFLYDNLSTDNFYSEIEDFIDNGEVELIEWPVINFVKGQCSCYTDAVYRCKGKADWLIFADTDLFFFPVNEDRLQDLLQQYNHPKIGGVTVNLLFFGTSGVEKLNKGERVTQLLTKCSGTIDKHVRCIVRPERVETVNNPHFVKYYPQYFAVDENLQRNEGPFNERRPCKKIRANHYALRTLDFLKREYGVRHARFCAEKAGKPLPIETPPEIWDKLMQLDASLSTSEDYLIQKFIF